MADGGYIDHVGYSSQDEDYARVREQFYGSPTKQAGDGKTREITFDCSVKSEQGLIIYDLVRHLRPSNTVEVGLAWGGSAIHILAALKANGRGHHVAIDPHQESWSNIGVLEPKRLQIGDDFTCLYERSDVVLPRMLSDGTRAQFIFIDGDHRFDGVFVDFYYSQQLLDVGGIMMFDDIGGFEVDHVVAFIKSNMPNLRQMNIPSMGRFAAFEKTGIDERPFSYAHPF